ncbi:MAG TPA: enoyl-CoA hydratase/isomerase family protein [Chromatiales bacterium]|nr:enoyl-CoA hydratase/isomerase family protein [Chromatiales bacterium]
MLITDCQGPVLKLTINRPEQRNALSLSLLDEIGACLLDHQQQSKLRCAIITAAGDRCFAAGGDLKELDAIRSEDQSLAMSQRGRRALDAIRQFPVPVVAALNGLALGGGAELAMACDLRVAAEHAEIGFLQGQLNVTTAWGGGIDLIALLGHQRALELLLSARRVSATEAERLGLFAAVCKPEQSLDDCVDALIKPWLDRSPAVMRGYKALTMAARGAMHKSLSTIEQGRFVETWVHEDHWAAVDAAARARTAKKN